MSNPYSNNDSFNSENNGAGYPGSGNELPAYGQGPYGQPGYAGSNYSGENILDEDVDAIQAIGDGFRYFGRNWAQWIFGPLLQGIVIFIIYLLLVAVLAASGTSIDGMADSGSGAEGALTGGLIAVMAIALIAMFLVILWAYSTWYRAANKQIETGELQFTDFLNFKNAGGLMAVYFLSNLIIGLGFLLLIIPGLFALFFFWWMPAVKAVRPELSVGECFGASIEVAKKNVGVTILLGVLLIVLHAVLSFTVVGLLIFPALQTLIAMLFVRRTLGMRG